MTGGIAALVYLVLAIVTPEDRSRAETVADEDESMEDDTGYRGESRRSPNRHRARYAIAAVLIVVGILFLISNLGVFNVVRWDLIWPVAIIALGLAILIPSIRR